MIEQVRELFKELFKNLNLQGLADFAGRLNERERWIVFGGAGAVAALLIVVIISTFMAALGGMERRIVQRRDELRKIAALRGKFIEIDRELSRLEEIIQQGGTNFSINSFLETTAAENGIKITSVNEKSAPPNDLYRERQVEVNLKQIYLRNLVDFLYKIENSPRLLRIKSLQVKPNYSNPVYLNVVFTVSTFESAR